MQRTDFARLRVLVVAERGHGLQTLRLVLALTGITRIHQIADGRRALELLRMEGYDVVFCEDGCLAPESFPALLRRTETVPNPMMPVIVFRERARRGNVERARDTGATDFITCPVSPRTVMRKLEAALHRPRAFIKAPGYFGPDRRRGGHEPWPGADRRIRPGPGRTARDPHEVLI